MASDRKRLQTLQALAAEGSGATDAERALAKKRADELEKKLSPVYYPDVTQTLQDLLNRQWQWNPVECLGCKNRFIREPEAPMWCSECLAKDAAFYKEADIVEDQYQDAPDEDYGYDIKEGDDW